MTDSGVQETKSNIPKPGILNLVSCTPESKRLFPHTKLGLLLKAVPLHIRDRFEKSKPGISQIDALYSGY